MDPQEFHTDLLLAPRALIKNSAVQIELQHVCGHQDSKQLGPFTQDATLNIEADLLAKTKLQMYTLVPGNIFPHSMKSWGLLHWSRLSREKLWQRDMPLHKWTSDKSILGKTTITHARDLE